MDLISVVLPAARSLAHASLSDTWEQARAEVAELWAQQSTESGSARAEVIGHIEALLDHVRQQAVIAAGFGSETGHAERMQQFWAGFLVTSQVAGPELADAIVEIPRLLGSPQNLDHPSPRRNTISGTVHGRVLQLGDVHGDITIG